jgi:hypothetical protein
MFGKGTTIEKYLDGLTFDPKTGRRVIICVDSLARPLVNEYTSILLIAKFLRDIAASELIMTG